MSVAECIGIEIEAVNFSAEYKERVFADFLREYQAGRTPNPDVLCNAEIKFKAFLDHAIALGAERIATGHYAQVREVDGHVRAAQGRGRHQGPELLPLPPQSGTALEDAVPAGRTATSATCARSRAELGLPNHAKKDSTGICFIGERPFREFLMRYLPTGTGRDGHARRAASVGRHTGLMYYTIGQRQGLGIGGAGEPWYVAARTWRAIAWSWCRGTITPRSFPTDSAPPS